LSGEEGLVGFVVTGDFNLKEGRGIGVGALSWQRAFVKGNKVGLVISFKIIDAEIMIGHESNHGNNCLRVRDRRLFTLAMHN